MNIEIGTMLTEMGGFKKIKIPENLTTTPNRNYFMIATQGSGKTNVLMLMSYYLYKLYIDTENKYGALPIIFAPTFEFMQLEKPSGESKKRFMPPATEPEGIPCVNITFPICDPIKHNNLQVCSFDFNTFDAPEILGFTDLSDDDKYLGAVKKLKERILNGYEIKRGKEKIEIPPMEFNLNNFIEAVREDSMLKDALYYVYTNLRDMGMFDNEKYPVINIKDLIKQKKPIIFHFGDLDERQRMSGIAGIILKQLWDVSNDYYNAFLKKQTNEELSEWEDFLLKNWTIALIMEEAHQILYATKSGGMSLESKHPAHYWFKKIVALMGRKRGFKYSFIVTQKFMEIFYGIRTAFDELIIGDNLYPDDKMYLENDLKIKLLHLNKMTKLPRYSWTFLDIGAYQKRKKRCASRVKVYLSPAGQDVGL